METENAIAHLDFEHEVTCLVDEFHKSNGKCSNEPRWNVVAPCGLGCSKNHLLLCTEHAGDLEAYLKATPAKILQCQECRQVYAPSSVKFVMLP